MNQIDTQAINKLGHFFRRIGLGLYLDYQRRNQPDVYEPWQNQPVNATSAVSDLYRLVHLGTPVSLEQTSLSRGEIQLLLSAGFASESGDFLQPANWRVTHFRDIFCVSEYGKPGGSDVYIGDDSLLFSDFLHRLPEAGSGLDIGFGSGISSIALAKSCASVVGVDIAAECVDAGYVSAALNGSDSRIRFLASAIEDYRPHENFDVVVGNPPGVPVPESLNYSLAGNGGEDGLNVIRRFLESSLDYCRDDGTIAMRFQSIAADHNIKAHSEIEALAKAHQWDVEMFVDISIPAEVRSALSTKNALPLNPQLNESQLLAVFDQHMSAIGATEYTSTLMQINRRGNGTINRQPIHTSIRLDTKIQPAVRDSALDEARLNQVQARFQGLIGNAPGILWRIAAPEDIARLSKNFGTIRRALMESRTPRDALRLVEPEAVAANHLRARGVIIPVLLAAEALQSHGLISVCK